MITNHDKGAMLVALGRQMQILGISARVALESSEKPALLKLAVYAGADESQVNDLINQTIEALID
jgi:hypothetical protein